MLRIEAELKRNDLSRFHLLFGEERYLVRYYKNLLIQKLSQPDDEMNCTLFQDKTVDPSHIAEAAQVMPFFAEHRLIVVEDSYFFKHDCDMLKYIETFPDTTYIVFVEREVNKRNRLYKWFNKNGCVTECGLQSERMLKQWIAGYVRKAGKMISVPAVERLLERVGSDMEILSNEMEKCIGYIGEKEEIDVEDVEAISSGVIVSKMFDMIDAVAMKERDKALRLYDDLLANRESPMSILHLFSRHINILLQMKECCDLGLPQKEIAKKCGIPSFTISKYARQSRLFKRDQLLDMLSNRLDYEQKFKSGKISDQMAVEMFLIQALTN